MQGIVADIPCSSNIQVRNGVCNLWLIVYTLMVLAISTELHHWDADSYTPGNNYHTRMTCHCQLYKNTLLNRNQLTR